MKYPLVLVQPFDAPVTSSHKEKDKDFGLFRVCAEPRKSSEIFPISSIIRGALLVKDFSDETGNDFLVFDLIDGDMFIRIKEMKE